MELKNPLKPFLTDVADGIRERKGIVGKIPAANFKSEILSIQGGESFNIAWGDTPPSDTTKLWVKTAEREKLTVKKEIPRREGVTTLSATLPKIYSSGAGYDHPAAVAVGTKIYLFGGYARYGSYYADAIHVFDTETETLTTLSTVLPTKTYGQGAAAVGTKIYLFGGIYVNAIHVFDTETETLTTLSTTFPNISNYYAMSVGVVNDKIYLFGGYTGNSSDFQKYCFDTATESLTSVAFDSYRSTSVSHVRNASTAMVGTDMYILGGTDSGSNEAGLRIRKINVETRQFITLSTALPEKIGSAGAVAVGTKIYLFGGANGSTVNSNAIRVFDTETETLTTLSTVLPTINCGMGTAIVNDKVYLFGGRNTSIVAVNIIPFAANSEAVLLANRHKNLFNLISSDTATLEMGVSKVYAGNENNEGKEVEACLYNNDTQQWEPIS